MARSEVKWGALLSYVLIALNSIYGLVIMPFVLGAIGESEYGVYKTIGAMTATISVMELGLGGTMQKYISQYRAQNEEKKAYNYSAMCIIQAIVMALAMIVVGVSLFFTLDPVYGNTFTATELIRAKQIYIVLVCYVVLHIFENVLFGIITGYNRFIFTNGVKLLTLVSKILIYLIILPIFKNSLAIVMTMVFLEFVIIAAECFYIKLVLKHQVKLYSWDKSVFKETFAYTGLLFIQSIIIQFNGNVDNMVIGSVIGTSAVTVYSFAIQIYNMYEQCSTSVSGVILPSVTKVIYSGATTKDLEDMAVKYGRVQWAVLGAALGGFICLGKEFFFLWLGEGFEDCYYLALILMVPVTLPLIVNTCLAILKAKNLLFFRTVALAYSAVFNVIFTVIGTRLWGFYAAAAGTALSTFIGSVISLNVYYTVKLKMNMLRVYFRIMHKIALCIAIPTVICFFINPYFSGSWVSFVTKAVIFMAVYGLLMLLFGLNSNEKPKILRRNGV
jgi:O-antigen/teichoic acid export membrane protein